MKSFQINRNYLWYAFRREIRLVIEDAAKMVAIREDLILAREIRSSGVHKLDAGKMIFHCNFLGPNVLLDCDWIVCSTLDSLKQNLDAIKDYYSSKFISLLI